MFEVPEGRAHHHVPLLAQPVRLHHVSRLVAAPAMPSHERQPAASLTPGDLEPILSDLRARPTPRSAGRSPAIRNRDSPCTRSTAARTCSAPTRHRSWEPLRLGRSTPTRRTRGRWRPRWGCRMTPMRSRRHRRPSGRASPPSCGREPVEDFRIDFEDGYGHRPDAEEDGHSACRRRGGRGGRRGRARCRRSSASESSRCRRTCTSAACGRSTCFVTTLAAQARVVVSIAAARHASEDRGGRGRCPPRRAPARRSSGGSGCRRDAAAGADDRDAAVDRRRRRDLAARARSSPPATAGSPACTSAPTTTPRSAASPRRGRTCAIPPATSRGG